MPAHNRLRSSGPIACDVSGFPRRFVRPHALARFSSCSFVYWPVAYSRNWVLSFAGHAELRVEQRGVTEVEVRAMLETATGFEASVVEGRCMVQTRRGQSPWS